MKKRVIIILLIVVSLIVGGGIMAWKWNQKEEAKSSNKPPINDSPSKIPLSKLSDKELKKCLLEDFSRRLELEKYFIFNLRELQTLSPGAENSNWRITSNRLDNDLTKLTVESQKHLEKQGYKQKGKMLCKNSIYFFGDNSGDILSFDNDFVRDLDQKISSGSWYILFEKEKTYNWPLGWFTIETDSNGQKWLQQTPAFQLRLKNSSTTICDSKEKALEFLKKNDPVLIGKF